MLRYVFVCMYVRVCGRCVRVEVNVDGEKQSGRVTHLGLPLVLPLLLPSLRLVDDGGGTS